MLTGEKPVQFANCVFCVNPCTDTESFLGDSVTKLITANIAIIKSGHNLSSDLKKLRYEFAHSWNAMLHFSDFTKRRHLCDPHPLSKIQNISISWEKFPRPSTLHSTLFLQATTFVIPCIMDYLFYSLI